MTNEFGFDEELVATIEERLAQLVSDVADIGESDPNGAVESTFDALYEAASDVLALSVGRKQPFGPKSAPEGAKGWSLVD